MDESGVNDFEHAMKACQLDELRHGGGWIQQLEQAALGTQSLVQREQDTEAGAVDEASVGEIDADLVLL
jgi:hypothetical protein